jgi:hypothetical protein
VGKSIVTDVEDQDKRFADWILSGVRPAPGL